VTTQGDETPGGDGETPGGDDEMRGGNDNTPGWADGQIEAYEQAK